MFQRTLRRNLLLGCTAGLLLLPGAVSFGQARAERGVHPRDAAEIVRHVQEGHIALREAVAIAEKHTSGQALEARARLTAKGSSEGKPDSYRSHLEPRQLIYEVTCFDKGKILVVQIDAQTRKVSEVKPIRTSPAAKP